ncbi:UNVERIFIED_CONTAM: hypothetical protein K2H54_061085 [Gekko kuhli]
MGYLNKQLYPNTRFPSGNCASCLAIRAMAKTNQTGQLSTEHSIRNCPPMSLGMQLPAGSDVRSDVSPATVCIPPGNCILGQARLPCHCTPVEGQIPSCGMAGKS